MKQITVSSQRPRPDPANPTFPKTPTYPPALPNAPARRSLVRRAPSLDIPTRPDGAAESDTTQKNVTGIFGKTSPAPPRSHTSRCSIGYRDEADPALSGAGGGGGNSPSALAARGSRLTLCSSEDPAAQLVCPHGDATKNPPLVRLHCSPASSPTSQAPPTAS